MIGAAQMALLVSGGLSLNYSFLLARPSLALLSGVLFAAGLWVGGK